MNSAMDPNSKSVVAMEFLTVRIHLKYEARWANAFRIHGLRYDSRGHIPHINAPQYLFDVMGRFPWFIWLIFFFDSITIFFGDIRTSLIVRFDSR